MKDSNSQLPMKEQLEVSDKKQWSSPKIVQLDVSSSRTSGSNVSCETVSIMSDTCHVTNSRVYATTPPRMMTHIRVCRRLGYWEGACPSDS